ncbi:MAG: hypothetical protein ACK4M3_00525 [Pyrobaculum sp.]
MRPLVVLHGAALAAGLFSGLLFIALEAAVAIAVGLALMAILRRHVALMAVAVVLYIAATAAFALHTPIFIDIRIDLTDHYMISYPRPLPGICFVALSLPPQITCHVDSPPYLYKPLAYIELSLHPPSVDIFPQQRAPLAPHLYAAAFAVLLYLIHPVDRRTTRIAALIVLTLGFYLFYWLHQARRQAAGPAGDVMRPPARQQLAGERSGPAGI